MNNIYNRLHAAAGYVRHWIQTTFEHRGRFTVATELLLSAAVCTAVARYSWDFHDFSKENIAYDKNPSRDSGNNKPTNDNTQAGAADSNKQIASSGIRPGHPYLEPNYTQKNIEYRLKRYSEETSDIKSLFATQSAVLALIIIAMLNREAKLKIPGVDYELKPTWFTLIAALHIWYSSLTFLSTLRSAINSRNALFELLSVSYLPGPDTAKDFKGHILSQRPLLADNGIVDAWFIAFRPERHDLWVAYVSETNGSIQQHVIALWGIFWGILCGSVFAAFRHLSTEASGQRNKAILLLAEQLSIMTLVGANILFAFAGNNRNWVQVEATVVATAAYLLMTAPSMRPRKVVVMT